MQKLSYSHSATGESGYQFLASESVTHCDRAELSELIRSLRFNPREIGEHIGWFWQPLSGSQRVFGRVGTRTRDDQSRVLEIRMIVATEAECVRVQWQPFVWKDELADQSRWQDIHRQANFSDRDSSGEPVPSDFEETSFRTSALNWQPFADQAETYLRLAIEAEPIQNRCQIVFVAPDVSTDPTAIRIKLPNQFSQVASKRKAGALGANSKPIFWSKVILPLSILVAIAVPANLLQFFQNCDLRQTNSDLFQNNKGLIEENDRLSLMTKTADPNGQKVDEIRDSLRQTQRMLLSVFDRLHPAGAGLEKFPNYDAGIRKYLKDQEEPELALERALAKWLEAENSLATFHEQTAKATELNTQLEKSAKSLRTELAKATRALQPLKGANNSVQGDRDINLSNTLGELLTEIEKKMSELEAISKSIQ